MNTWRLGILGAANIAFNRFLPALQKNERFVFGGIASRNAERCRPFLERFGGRCYTSYEELLSDPEIDCVYVPLPPALHAQWGRRVLESGKHLLMEKPFSTTSEDTKELLKLADDKGLAVHENYMFLYHRQFATIQRLMEQGELGTVRMIRTAFTFPYRGANDFRYDPVLGGGALLDCGGYPLLLASKLLGDSARLCWSDLHREKPDGVDTAGSAVLQNSAGLTAHVFFGMNDTYRCEAEIWGSKASLTAGRVFTAPPELEVNLQLRVGNENHMISIEADDQFYNSINAFADLMEQPVLRQQRAENIMRQSCLVEEILQRDQQK